MANDKALVIFSGGQDSTTCLYWAIERFGRANVRTITFDYGQTHNVELKSAKAICDYAGIEFDLIQIPDILRSASPLTNTKAQLEKHDQLNAFSKGVQNTFVPGRNILFLTLAANVAYSQQANNLVIGVCEEDFGGYYDCRSSFIKAMEEALSQGLYGRSAGSSFKFYYGGNQQMDPSLRDKESSGLKIHTPLMSLNKKETVDLAVSLGESCLEALALSHTCYDGSFPPCGICHSCHLRARGFKEAGVEDPLMKRAKGLLLN